MLQREQQELKKMREERADRKSKGNYCGSTEEIGDILSIIQHKTEKKNARKIARIRWRMTKSQYSYSWKWPLQGPHCFHCSPYSDA
jgi:hypothetical protein